ncbi:hypothetical protein HG536_0B02490 [Torulaspora globosa]|uniref:Autophagy-related protein 11 n=1 Tax=Torulaspora globosa TaxID=48254 RepID=A0A7G3ZD00_9SACH|nr:uncharacterized protein HG536_0B02490 [Torulaspora globosa]QLL31386.1 hypothetical protein HG536_0B02490 [Torulaspora globosa]
MSDNAYLINAITGEKITTDVKYFMSLDEFRDFISQKWNISQEQLLILLPFGNKLKNSAFKECLRTSTLSEAEFYIYDRRLFSIMNEPIDGQPTGSLEKTRAELADRSALLVSDLVNNGTPKEETSLLKPINSPLADADMKVENLTSRVITSLLTTNLGWLSALEIDVHYFRVLIAEYIEQISEILKCLSICEQYLKLYCYDVEKLYNSNVEFLNQLSQNSQSCKWRSCYNDVLTKLKGSEGPLSQYVDLQRLEENEKELKSLDKTVNAKLKKVKTELDSNADFRMKVSGAIQSIQKDYDPEGLKDRLEKTMLEKFEELVEDVRTRSREILDQDLSDSPEAFVEEIRQFLLKVKNETSSRLFTIAQALFAQIERVLERRSALQAKAVLLYGQIAYVQMETIGIKRNLLTECGKDLNRYQEKELQFAQVEDIPLIYGLFLIERYRRECWSFQLFSQTQATAHELKQAKEKEINYQAEWVHNFGNTASLFCSDLGNISEIGNLDALRVIDEFDGQIISEKQLSAVQTALSETLKIIDGYVSQLPHLGVSKNVSEIILQTLSETKNYQSSIFRTQELPEKSAFVKDQVNGYRARIKILESLLHEARFSNPGHWPSGILNPVHVTPFHNNVATVGPKGSPGSSSLIEANNFSNVVKFLEMDNNYQSLQEKVNKLQAALEAKETLLIDAGRKTSDLELEIMAFKESMSHLNQGLARLSEKEEKTLQDARVQRNDFKTQLTNIAEENASLLKELNNMKDELSHKEAQEKAACDRIAELQQLLEEERVHSREKIVLIENDLSAMKTHTEELEKKNEELTIKLQEQDSEKLEKKEKVRIEASAEQANDEVSRTFKELQVYSTDVEHLMFNVFASDVFILENIGLLLSLDDNNGTVIRRVKGLRRVQSQGLLDDSIQIPQAEIVVKSTVYKEVKEIYESLGKTQDIDKHRMLVSKLKVLYANKLYESAVIRRFKDIETLAKKLTKENKKKRSLLDSYQNERVTLRNFQVGDLALFLPTRENKSLNESSISSLNSSFSSVDLSTPPPFDVTSTHPPHASKEKAKKVRKHRPWAAFTAFDNNTRYFLKDDEEFTRGKDWFVGKILTMESFLAEDGNNPYKLTKGSQWFEVTAKIVSCPV